MTEARFLKAERIGACACVDKAAEFVLLIEEVVEPQLGVQPEYVLVLNIDIQRARMVEAMEALIDTPKTGAAIGEKVDAPCPEAPGNIVPELDVDLVEVGLAEHARLTGYRIFHALFTEQIQPVDFGAR